MARTILQQLRILWLVLPLTGVSCAHLQSDSRVFVFEKAEQDVSATSTVCLEVKNPRARARLESALSDSFAFQAPCKYHLALETRLVVIPLRETSPHPTEGYGPKLQRVSLYLFNETDFERFKSKRQGSEGVSDAAVASAQTSAIWWADSDVSITTDSNAQFDSNQTFTQAVRALALALLRSKEERHNPGLVGRLFK